MPREARAGVDRCRLEYKVERLEQAFSNRQAEGAIQANSEWRVDDELRAAKAIEEALDDDGLFIGNSTERLDPAAHVVGGLRGRAFRHRAFSHQPVDR